MTTKKRNKIYKGALEEVEIKNCLDKYSICAAIKNTSLRVGEFVSSDSLFEVFPEFYLFKPSRKDQFIYWLASDDLQTRQIILDFCILMTES